MAEIEPTPCKQSFTPQPLPCRIARESVALVPARSASNSYYVGQLPPSDRPPALATPESRVNAAWLTTFAAAFALHKHAQPPLLHDGTPSMRYRVMVACGYLLRDECGR